MDTGGNCGSQSATLIIRGIALDEIRFTDLFKVMFKEFRISLIVGAFLAVANGVRIFIQYHNPGLAVVIACSLMGTVIMAKAGWMYPPTSCQESKSRPCDYGISTDHNSGGYLLNLDLL